MFTSDITCTPTDDAIMLPWDNIAPLGFPEFQTDVGDCMKGWENNEYLNSKNIPNQQR